MRTESIQYVVQNLQTSKFFIFYFIFFIIMMYANQIKS